MRCSFPLCAIAPTALQGEVGFMRAQKVVTRKFEFYFPHLDNLIQVENFEEGAVIIRATRDNFSEQRKLFFIRELAAEGFIPDTYQWGKGCFNELKWVIDYSWLKLPRVWARRSRRFMVRLIIFGGLLWLAAMRVAYVSQPSYSHGADSAHVNPYPGAAHLVRARR